MDIKKITKEKILFFDGAMGTMLQKKGLPVGGLPELYNLTKPELIRSIHEEYVQAGSDVISTNTFQANALKIPSEYSVEEIIDCGIKIAKSSGCKYVALDIGPLGQLMEPMGTLKFEQAYDLFKQQMVQGEKSGADCIILETFSDLYEMKVAILAAKENTALPVICSMTYQEDGRTFVGTDPITATIALQDLGADALGVNCSLGPDELSPIVETILEYSHLPVIVQANAGLPCIEHGETVYKVEPEQYANTLISLIEKGVSIVGGCCGTTPEFIKHIKDHVGDNKPTITQPKVITAATSGTKTVIYDNNITIVGERINPTGKKMLQAALRSGDNDYIINEAISQYDTGSDILDINVGLPDIDEPNKLEQVVKEVQNIVPIPLQIDSTDHIAIEKAVRIYNGKPVINSVNGKQDSMDNVFPIVKKYGALIIGLTLDESGIPDTAEKRLKVAEKILDNALKHGIPKQNIIIDCLVLTASAQQDQVMVAIETVKLVKQKLGLKTILGVSNVSFGLPSRDLLNTTFLAAGFGAGLDAAIVNTLSSANMKIIDTFRVLNSNDKDSKHYVEKYGNIQQENSVNKPSSGDSLDKIIIQGRKNESAPKVKQLLDESIDPLEIINNYFIPALNYVGDKFATGKLFLPQLMQSAEAVKNGFDVINLFLSHSDKPRESKGNIILATVEGDIHDIGKNITKMLLSNYGYNVIDLGKDVKSQVIVDTIKQYEVSLVGLSALMTTTVKSMKDTIETIKNNGLECEFMVGGAVLNEEYKEFVGADYYAKDAMEGVNIAKKVFDK